MKILVLDNYDSFTYNLVQYITELTGEMPSVVRNDKIDLQAVAQFDTIVLSPGPGLPADAGIMPQLIQQYAPTKRILGVCLGHQAIGEAFGGKLYNLKNVYHGIASPIQVIDENNILFENVPVELVVGRYHSWAISTEGFPKELKVTAQDDKGVIMAMSHHTYEVHGVQFHPESVMTDYGKQILKNFLRPLNQQNKVGQAIEYMF
jgi:anthranilate synthase component II